MACTHLIGIDEEGQADEDGGGVAHHLAVPQDPTAPARQDNHHARCAGGGGGAGGRVSPLSSVLIKGYFASGESASCVLTG